ncbi:hypothetical protein N7454_010535 [Penicillium verhagenii]|nr:hypothetical protein N7454_010535 [Penicillium verhagenii]
MLSFLVYGHLSLVGPYFDPTSSDFGSSFCIRLGFHWINSASAIRVASKRFGILISGSYHRCSFWLGTHSADWLAARSYHYSWIPRSSVNDIHHSIHSYRYYHSMPIVDPQLPGIIQDYFRAQATSTSLPAGQVTSESENPGFTTSTVFTTRVATITACPASITDCPARSKTTFLTTETIVDSTTVCPLTEVTQATSTKLPKGQASSTSEAPSFTTSTMVSTRVATITACPASVTNCPARMKTTSLTTETIVVSTTVCPVVEAVGATQTGSPSGSSAQTAGGNGNGNGGSESTISTVWSTRIATVTACPLSVTNCPLRSKTTYLTTETLAVGTAAVAVSAENTSVPSEGAAVTPSIINANPSAANTATVSFPAVTAGAQSGSSGSTGGQGSGSGLGAEAVYTALYTMESCANGDTCTEYVSTVVTTQTNVAVAQPTMTSASYKPASGSGAQGHPAASASSAHAWPQGSQAAGASSAYASSTSSAPYAVYTGAASSISQLSMLQISATLMVMLAAILA